MQNQTLEKKAKDIISQVTDLLEFHDVQGFIIVFELPCEESVCLTHAAQYSDDSSMQILSELVDHSIHLINSDGNSQDN